MPAEGAYWVDWSKGRPVIRLYDESAPEGTQWLTLLEAREEILKVAITAINQWMDVAREAMSVTPEEIESR